MSQFVGSTAHPLMGDFWGTYSVPEFTWQAEAETIGNRGESLACNDPFCASLINAELQGEIGPIGLRLSSQYDSTPDDAGTSAGDRATRRSINAISAATWMGRGLDADGLRTRREIEWAVAWWAKVRGDGFAIRVMRDGHSAWQLVHPRRVRNPAGAMNTKDCRDGFQFDPAGRAVGIWVFPPNILWDSTATSAGKPTLVPLTAPDGTPNVIHRVGYRLPGMLRGVSILAPIILMAKQVQAVLESHVAGKRVQAIHPLIVEAEDPAAYQAAVADGTALDPTNFKINSPLQLWIKPPGSSIDFPDTKFNGADVDSYIRSMYRTQCATRGLPIEVVLCQMGDASLSSARAGLDQAERTFQTGQEAHIAECAEPMDRVAVSDAVADGDLSGVDIADPLLTAGTYSRPPKYSTDRQKDMNTVIAAQDAGVSGTTAFASVGLSWEDEQERRRAEAEFLAAQGIPPLVEAGAPGVRVVDPAAPNPAATPSPDQGGTPTPSTTPNGDQPPAGDPPKGRARATLHRRAVATAQQVAA